MGRWRSEWIAEWAVGRVILSCRKNLRFCESRRIEIAECPPAMHCKGSKKVFVARGL